MLPQPNFGPSSVPDAGDEEVEGPPKKLGRLRIALWVQTVFAVLAGNVLVMFVLSARQATFDELLDVATERGAESPTESAQSMLDSYQSTQFLLFYLVPVAIMIIAAVLSALCAIRLKTRMKSVRRVAIAASIVLMLLAMFTTLMVPAFFLLLMLWVFASILAVWWLFSGDVKDWMSESLPPAETDEPDEA